MANTNTLAALYNLSLANPTTETIFAASGATKRAPSGIVTVRPDIATGLFDGRPLRLRIAGKATVGVSENTTVKVYANYGGNTDLTTLTNDVAVLSTGTMASGAAASFSFCHSVLLLWDSVSKQVCGYTEAGGIKNIPTTPAVLQASATISTTNPVKTSEATVDVAFTFFATALVSTGSATDVITLLELALEQV